MDGTNGAAGAARGRVALADGPVDPLPDYGVPGELIVRDGILVRLVPDDWVPQGGWPAEAFQDGAPWPDEVPYTGPTDPVGWDVFSGTFLGGADVLSSDEPASDEPAFDEPATDEQVRDGLTVVPGVALARAVAAAVDPVGPLVRLADDVLGDLVVACGRLQSWAAGLQARVVAERAGRENSALAHSSLVAQVTSELVVTGPEGSEIVVRGESGADHPTVITALVSGGIDVKKAHTLLRSAAQLTTQERAEAIDRYLPHAPSRTWRWLRSKMLAFAKSRHGADQAAKAAAERRTVQLDRADNDMAWLSAYLPAVDAAAVWGVVDDMAHQLCRTSGEERDLGQLRADCLTGIVTGRLLPADRFDAAPTSDAPTSGCTCGGSAPVKVVRVVPSRPVVRVTVPASALVGVDDAPGELAGLGPVPAATARRIARDATWQRLVTDPVTGVLLDYSTTAYRPGRALRAAVEARDETCTFPGCDRAAAWCDLDHIEPFDHDQKTANDRVRARGQTNAHNLHALCRRHHLLKTHAGWGVVRDAATGITTWTTPTGRTSVRPPTVLDTHVEIDQVDPASSYDLSLRALTGRRLPRDDGAAPRPESPTWPPF